MLNKNLKNISHHTKIKKSIYDSDISLYREPIFVGSKIYRATQTLIQILSQGADMPDVNHPNFYKVVIYLKKLKKEYPRFDDQMEFESILRGVEWETIMK